MRKKSVSEKNSAFRIICTAPWRLTKVVPLENYQIAVEFVDGTTGYVDLVARITSTNAGVFANLKDKAVFNQVYLEHGVATWPGEIDLAPDAMYDAIKKHGKWVLT